MTTTVYVKLRDEGTDVWRPVVAEAVGANRYRILDYPGDDEVWPVAHNEIVECELRTLSDGEHLVAKKL